MTHTMRGFALIFKSVPLFCDNTNAISLVKNPYFHGKVKHIKVRHHFLRDNVEKGEIVMRRVETEKQLADIFTKSLDPSCFATLRGELDIHHPYAYFEGERIFLVQSLLFYFYFLLLSYHII